MNESIPGLPELKENDWFWMGSFDARVHAYKDLSMNERSLCGEQRAGDILMPKATDPMPSEGYPCPHCTKITEAMKVTSK